MTLWNPLGLRDQKVIDHANEWLTAVYETGQVPLNQILTHAKDLLEALEIDSDITALDLGSLPLSASKKSTAAKLLFLYNCVIHRMDKEQLMELFTLIIYETKQRGMNRQVYRQTKSNYIYLLNLLTHALTKDKSILSMAIMLLPTLEQVYCCQKPELEKIKTTIAAELIKSPKLLIFENPWQNSAALLEQSPLI